MPENSKLIITQAAATAEVRARLTGAMDENSDYSSLRVPDSHLLVLDMSEITRCNSSGILVWTRFLRSLPAGARIAIDGLAPALLPTVNLFPAFLDHPNVTVRSFFLVYACDGCNLYSRVLVETNTIDLNDDFWEAAAPSCAKCGCLMDLDAAPEKHFLFLKRRGRT